MGQEQGTAAAHSTSTAALKAATLASSISELESMSHPQQLNAVAS